MPKILCAGREWLRGLDVRLEVTNIPADAPRPLTICQVCAAPDVPDWREEPGFAYDTRAIILGVYLPLTVTVRDAAGCVHTGRSVICVRVRVPLRCPREDCWRYQWVILPSVKMVRCSQPSCDDVFDVCLEVCVEAYLVRPEPVCRSECRPVCPPLPPLYPQPAGGHSYPFY